MHELEMASQPILSAEFAVKEYLFCFTKSCAFRSRETSKDLSEPGQKASQLSGKPGLLLKGILIFA
jgi:hypothetical protein